MSKERAGSVFVVVRCCPPAHAAKRPKAASNVLPVQLEQDALLLVLKNFICEHAGGFEQRSRRVLRLRAVCSETS